jgi:hypothetical protein
LSKNCKCSLYQLPRKRFSSTIEVSRRETAQRLSGRLERLVGRSRYAAGKKPHFMPLTVQSKIPGYFFKLDLLFMLTIMIRFFERRISYANLQFISLFL